MECQVGVGREPMEGEWPSRRSQKSKEDIPAKGWSSKGCQIPNRARKVSCSRRENCSCMEWPGMGCQSPGRERSMCGNGLL